MKFFDYIRFAFKNLWRQRLRSLLTIFAIVIGALSVISMISLVLGASQVFLQQLNSAGTLTQIQVVGNKDATADTVNNGSDGTGTKLDDALVAKIAKVSHVISVSPIANVYPLRSFVIKDDANQKKYTVDNIQGYVPGPATDKSLEAGRNLTADDKEGKIIVGAQNAETMGFKDHPDQLIGKTLIFTTQPGYAGEGAVITPPPTPIPGQPGNNQLNDPQSQPTTQIEAVIVGVTAPGGDDRGGFINLEWAKGLLTDTRYQQDQAAQQAYQQEQQRIQQLSQQSHTPYNGPQPTSPPMVKVTTSQLDQQGYTSIIAKADSFDNVDAAATVIKTYNVGAVTAKEFLDTITRTFKIVGLVFGAIGAISLLVASIGVINTMVMATLERTREIGVMRACGATRGAVSRLFTFEAAMLGFWGGVTGVVLGYGLSKIANVVVGRILVQQHFAAANVVVIPWWLALAVIGATTVIGMLAGLYPAYRASRLNPVEALRYE